MRRFKLKFLLPDEAATLCSQRLIVLPCSLPTIQQGIALPDPLLLFFLPRRQISIDCITQNLLASGFQFAATDKWLRYWPSQVGPEQKCPFCSVSFEPIERDGVGFRRKGKLHSLIRGWRGVSWGSTACALLERPGRDCFIGILSVGRSRSSQGVGAAVLHVPDCSAGCVRRLRTPKLSSHFAAGTPVWGLCTRHSVSPRNSTKHRGADGGAVCPPLSFWAVGLAAFFHSHSPSCLLPCDASSLRWVLVTSYTGSSTEIPFRFQVGTAPLLLAQGGPPLQVVLSVRSLQWNPLESVFFLIPAGTWTDTVTRCQQPESEPKLCASWACSFNIRLWKGRKYHSL